MNVEAQKIHGGTRAIRTPFCERQFQVCLKKIIQRLRYLHVDCAPGTSADTNIREN